MKPIKIEDISVEMLDKVAWQWQEDRIAQLVRGSVIELGEQLREARKHTGDIELRARIRAMRLHHQHGFTKKEIAELLGLELTEVRRWLK